MMESATSVGGLPLLLMFQGRVYGKGVLEMDDGCCFETKAHEELGQSDCVGLDFEEGFATSSYHGHEELGSHVEETARVYLLL